MAAALAATSLVALSGVARAGAAGPTYYVSVGDSYSVGYQPGIGATTGYTGYVTKKTHLTLANFGCGGATTASIIDTVGCPDVLPHTAGAHLYPTVTQAAAADAFLSAHRGHIGLITVSIGGNDVTACAAQAVTSFPPMDTVISPMWPRWALRNASAAAACVMVG